MALNSGDHPLHFVSDEKSVVIAQGRLCTRVEVNDRVSLKIKNSLRPEELTPATFMYEESITPVACFLDFGIERPIFWSPKTTIFTNFGNNNMGLRTPNSESGEHFLTHKNYPQIGGSDTCFR